MTKIGSVDYNRYNYPNYNFNNPYSNYAVNNPYQNYASTQFTGKNHNIEADTFEKKDKSNNGEFDLSEAGKNFFKGLISPITAAIKHPLATIGIVAGTIAACSILPILGPALAIGFGAYSLYQVGKGIYDVADNYSKGNYDAAEKSFNTVGEGTAGTVLSALGVRQSAKVAKEAKLMSELNTSTLSEAQKAEVAASIKENGFFANLKENFSLFTTKDGLKATGHQFKWSTLQARLNEFKNFFSLSKWKQEKTVEDRKPIDFKKRIEKFKQSPEGQRRASLTDEQIKTELEALYNEAFDRLNVPKENRPNLEFEVKSAEHGGCYGKNEHTIKFNPEAYRSGVMDIEDVIMHEATHCKEALLRAGIPQDKVDIIVRDELINRLRNGESEQIIKGGNIFGPDMMEPPKMSQAMKEDFAEFALNELYKRDNNLYKIFKDYDTQTLMKTSKNFKPEEYEAAKEAAAPILEKLRALMAKHPDFAKQYSSEQEALDALMGYAQSHNFRYQVFTDVKINGSGNPYSPKYLDIEPLSSEDLAHAEQSLVDYITTIEGNGRTSGFKIFGPTEAEFNQYQFSPEEVLAQKNGNNFLIEKMTAKMEAMRKAGELSAEDEAYLTQIIEKAKNVIEYKTKGLEYYKKYTELINNPNNQELKAAVDAMANELAELKSKISPEDYEITTRVIKVFRTPEHATTSVPRVAIYNLINMLKEEA